MEIRASTGNWWLSVLFHTCKYNSLRYVNSCLFEANNLRHRTWCARESSMPLSLIPSLTGLVAFEYLLASLCLYTERGVVDVLYGAREELEPPHCRPKGPLRGCGVRCFLAVIWSQVMLINSTILSQPNTAPDMESHKASPLWNWHPYSPLQYRLC